MREAEISDPLAFIENLLANPEDGRLKLFVTTRALALRRANAELFSQGRYEPLTATGRRADSVVAFARAHEEACALVVAARFFTRLGVGREGTLSLSAEAWADTRLLVGEFGGKVFRDRFTGREFKTDDGTLAVAEVLSPMPVALLELQRER